MNAPVVLFVYNRLDHTMNVIESLSKNILADQTDLYVFSDAAKTENVQEKVNAVREYIRRTEWRDNFQNVTIVEAKQNQGLAKSIISGVTEILEKYGKVIVVEDDLVLSPYFLNYMNGALDYYKDVDDVWSISGYSFPMKSLKKYPHDISAIIGIDMATPLTYNNWSEEEIKKRTRLMRVATRLKFANVLCQLNNRSLTKDEINQHKLLRKRNAFNICYINEAGEVLNNSRIVSEGENIICPTLLFSSNSTTRLVISVLLSRLGCVYPTLSIITLLYGYFFLNVVDGYNINT